MRCEVLNEFSLHTSNLIPHSSFLVKRGVTDAVMPSPEDAAFYLETLRRVVSPPTASFHEEHVGAVIAAFLTEHDLPYTVDRFGNILAHYHQGPESRPLALMAHTDHPGFELIAPATDATAPSTWTARVLGGVGADYFQQPTAVTVFAGNDPAAPVAGTVRGAAVGDGPRDLRLAIELAQPERVQPGNFGIWALPDFELHDGFIHARAIDDLAGCAAALLTLAQLRRAGADAHVYGVFTRAEEVGLVGADLVFAHAALPRETLVVSLEASRTLPGAAQGEGPVIRVGDRVTTFNDEAEALLRQAATGLQAAAPPGAVKVQRQLMSGGRCEASTAQRHGYATTGLAFPLGNYHNMGVNATLQPENIHEQDFLTAVDLLLAAARLLPQLPTLLAAGAAADAPPPAYVDRLLATRAHFPQT
jgi:endoglucanase